MGADRHFGHTNFREGLRLDQANFGSHALQSTCPRYLYYILPLTRDKPVKPAYPGELSARPVGDQKCKFGHTSLVTGVMI
jgi:hypothetical protein